MKNAINLFKWAVILVITIALILFFRGCLCNKKGDTPPIRKETSKSDTFWRERKADTIYIPQLVKVTVPKPYTVHDTLEFTERIPADTAAILKDYFATASYSDTQYIKEGSIVINDEVTKNRIASRRLITNFSIPEVTKTVTITEKYPRKVVFFVGGGLAGNKQTPFFGVEGLASLQFKNLKTYSVGYMLTKTGDPLYTFRFSIPIRLGRK